MRECGVRGAGARDSDAGSRGDRGGRRDHPGAANRDRLRAGGIVVWLRVDAAAIEARAFGADHRPWLDTGGASWIRDTVAERDPLYASIADIVIDTGIKPAEDSAAELLAWLGSVAACRVAIDSGMPPARDR